MAKQYSNTSNYHSRFGGAAISISQFIAEIMCERIAKKNGQDLPVKFWNLPTWKKQFLLQVMGANSLLKLYSPKAIIAAINKDKRAYSLRAPWLVDAIQQEEDVLNRIVVIPPKDVEETKEVVVGSCPPRKAFTPKKSSLKKLRELDE